MAAKKLHQMATPRASIPLNLELDRRARKVLINARVAASLTQQELAARLGRAQSFVSRIEHGKLAIKRAHFAAIARALGEDPHALFAKVFAGPIGRLSKTRARTLTPR
jgi:transcriptional regulator with XRE-family HTH domain